jgi:hypothetical protein
MFGGGSAAPAEPQDQQMQSNNQSAQQQQWGNNCAGVTQQFTKCMDDNNGNMQICNWYLEQLVRHTPWSISRGHIDLQGMCGVYVGTWTNCAASIESLPGCCEPVLEVTGGWWTADRVCVHPTLQF